jgi:thiamine pyrophosphate-dependent acetolactate synthase large subunit-like protein
MRTGSVVLVPINQHRRQSSITTLDELSAAVKEARALDVPAVIEVPIDPAEYHAHAAPPRQRRTPRVP